MEFVPGALCPSRRDHGCRDRARGRDDRDVPISICASARVAHDDLPGEEFSAGFCNPCSSAGFTKCATMASGARTRRGTHCPRWASLPRRCARSAGRGTFIAPGGSSARATSRQWRNRHDPQCRVPTRGGCRHGSTTRITRPDALTHRARRPRDAPHTGLHNKSALRDFVWVNFGKFRTARAVGACRSGSSNGDRLRREGHSTAVG